MNSIAGNRYITQLLAYFSQSWQVIENQTKYSDLIEKAAELVSD